MAKPEQSYLRVGRSHRHRVRPGGRHPDREVVRWWRAERLPVRPFGVRPASDRGPGRSVQHRERLGRVRERLGRVRERLGQNGVWRRRLLGGGFRRQRISQRPR
jgi:hypothetical protein